VIRAGTDGPLDIEVQVLFRSFAPASLRDLGLEQYVETIAEPFLMAGATASVIVGR
jgi:hypothetical protein